MSWPIASVVVPAHNEQAHLRRTLTTLTAGLAPGELEIVVVCNGCNDGTAAVARSFPGVVVVEMNDASKSAALRAGDAVARVFPRMYLDADVELTSNAARAIAGRLRGTEPAVAGVRAEIDLRRSSRGVRWFYDFRQRLPVFQGGVIGAGVYAMNETARARFGPWPEVIGDDQFVFRLFEPRERLLVAGHRTLVIAPRDLGEVVRRGVRVRCGNRELDRGGAGIELHTPAAGLRHALRDVAWSPRDWIGAATFMATTLVIRLRSLVGVEPDWHERGRAPISP